MTPDDESDETAGPQGDSRETAKLVESLKAFVQEEIRKGALATAREPPKTRGDVVWLFLLVVNLAMLASFVPAGWLKDERLDLVVKLLPWLFSALLFADWFRARLIWWTSMRWWKAAQVTVFVALFLLRLPVFSFRVRVGPTDARLWVDGQEIRDSNRRIWRQLGHHVISIRSSEQERAFDLDQWGLLEATLDWTNVRELNLIYPINVEVSKAAVRVSIRKSAGTFDEEFMHGSNISACEGNPPRPLDQTTLVVTTSSPGIFCVALPYGEYKVREDRQGCVPTTVKSEPGPIKTIGVSTACEEN